MLLFRSVSTTPLLCVGVGNHACIQHSKIQPRLESNVPRQLPEATFQLAGPTPHWGTVMLQHIWQMPPCLGMTLTFFILCSWSVHEIGLLLLQPTLRWFGVRWEKQEGMLVALAFAFGQDALSLHTDTLRPFRIGSSTRNRGIFWSKRRLSNKKFGV